MCDIYNVDILSVNIKMISQNNVILYYYCFFLLYYNTFFDQGRLQISVIKYVLCFIAQRFGNGAEL